MKIINTLMYNIELRKKIYTIIQEYDKKYASMRFPSVPYDTNDSVSNKMYPFTNIVVDELLRIIHKRY
jgi:hypothetical protein